jgi:hypothetical protein
MGRQIKKRQIAPRLANGDSRESFTHGLPPGIKAGLKAIAKMEGESVSWALEQSLIRFFKLPQPRYKKRKK